MVKTIWRKLSEHRFIETERLLLRPVSLDDAEDMYVYASDEENLRFAFEVNKTLEDTKNNIAMIYLASPLGRYGIELKSEKKLIGTLDLHSWDMKMLKVEVGYCLNKSYWNQGFATEAMRAIVPVVFEALGVTVLKGRCDQDNIASAHVLEKSGLLFSHLEPYAKYDKKDRTRLVTMCHYQLTKEDYFRKNMF